MPIKKTTKTESKTSKVSEKKVKSKTENKKNAAQRVVVKRRKSDLKPTKASAVAIVAQASRAKKQALIEKVASSDVPYKKKWSDTKIPVWVRVFFGASLLLFCISFYKAIICPQLDWWQVNQDENIEFLMEWDINNTEGNNQIMDDIENESIDDVNYIENSWLKTPETITETIEEFFSRLSDRNFDEAFDLMIPVLRNATEIREHFTSFRMNPFLDWIQWWKLIPTNFIYVSSPAYWKDTYSFDLSYVMNSDQSQYDETWEFTVNTQWNDLKISSIRCTSAKCSYHPIFWPENFGLMR